MKTYNWKNKETKTYKEISNKDQSWMSKDETLRVFKTDDIAKHENEDYDTRFEEVNK